MRFLSKRNSRSAKLVVGIVALGLLCASSRPVAARPNVHLTISADVSPRRVILGDSVRLTITITRAVKMTSRGGVVGRVYDRFIRPSMPEFAIVGRSSSETTQIVFGTSGANQVTRQTITFELRPKRTGKLRIGSAKVRLGGQVVQSRPLTVLVLGSGASLGSTGSVASPPGSGGGAAGAGTAGGGASVPGQVVPKGDLSIVARVDKKSVFVGQQVEVSWYLYHTSPLIRFVAQDMPDAANAVVEDLYQIGPQTTSRQQVIGGTLYYVTPLYRKAFFPRQPGVLTVSALKMELTTLAMRYSGVRSVLRACDPVKVTVLSLPAKGRPQGFPLDGRNVGTYALQASVDRFTVKAGEAVTLTVKVTVAGHPELADLPPIGSLDGFKVRASKPRIEVQGGDQVAGVKTYEYVLIGIKAGHWKVPPFELDFFDPGDKAYHVVRTKPIDLTVVGSLSEVVQTASGQNVLKVGIRPIHRDVRMVSRIGPKFYSSLVFKVLFFLPLFLLAGLVVFERVRRHLSEDTESRRWRRTKGRAKLRLRTARRLLEESNASAFFAEVSRVISEILDERLGVRVSGLTTEELRARMESAGLPADLVETVIRELQACDFARFAPAASSKEEMVKTLDRVRDIVDRISRSKVSGS